MKNIVLSIMLLGLWVTSAGAMPFYAISGDDSGIPRRVNFIDTDAATVTPLFDLGDGSLGFFGLTFTDGKFYTLANDGFGASTLHSFDFTDGGGTSALFSLGAGFKGGIAARSNNLLYAIANDSSGASSLYSLDLTTASAIEIDSALGFGLAGGLTWNADDQLLYALGSDLDFVQTLFSINPAVPGSATAVTSPLGMGIIGGVDYVGTDEFLAIGNERGFSELLSLSLGAVGTPLLSLAPFPSYSFSALTSAPPADIPPITPVSEPPVLWLLLPGYWVLLRLSMMNYSSGGCG